MEKLNGIFIEYHDHLSMDAFRVWAYKDGFNILKRDKCLLVELTNNSKYQLKDASKELTTYNGISVLMVNSCAYYGTLGLRDTIRIIKSKYPELNVYAFEIGWYTFPQQWRPVGNLFSEHIYKDIVMIDGRSEDYFKQFKDENTI